METAGRRGRRGHGRDMVGASVPPKREKDLIPPTRVVGGRRVQHNGHEGPNVMHCGGLSVESGDVVDVESRGEGALGVNGGASWATGGWPRVRRCAVAIWVVRAAPMARSCSRARDAARSHSCEASTTAWMVAMAVTSAESVEGVGGAQVASTTSGRMVGKPGAVVDRSVPAR
jgi:hypothetical protein